MDIEQKRDYLKSYRILEAKIKRIKYMLKHFPESSEKYNMQMNEALLKREKIEAEIDSVDGSVLSEILAEKYICGKSLEEIALIIGYCKRQTERLHIKALNNFSIA